MLFANKTGYLEDLALDLRLAVRSLRRSPTFTAVSTATVAIAVGATTAVLSIGNAVLLRPPPVVEPARLVSVWEIRNSSFNSFEGRLLPYPRFEAYREATRDVFEDVAGHGYRGFTMSTDEGAVSIGGFQTSGNYWQLLGLTPLLGRLYDSDDEESVVLSERTWRARFGADPDVVGRTISVSGRTLTIAGVAGSGFTGTASLFSGDLWVPARAFARLAGAEITAQSLVPIGRLLPGLERDLAEERVAAIARTIPPEAPNIRVSGARLDRLQWRADTESVLNIGLGVLLATAVLVLLIACANVAAMTVARAHAKRREVAVRLAIGAGRGRLVRQLITESMLLALIGGAGGVVLSQAGTSLLSSLRFPIDVAISLDATPDRLVLVASLAVATMTGLLFGLRPALRTAGADLTTALKEGSQGPRATRRRHAFLVGQLALATLLLVTAGLFVRSLVAIVTVPLGFDPEGVQVASVSIGQAGYGEEEGRLFYARLLEEVRALPGVQAAGLARWVLLGGGNASRDASAADAGEEPPRIEIEFNTVDPGFFEVSRIGLVEGRLLTDADTEGAPRVAVINQTLAERLWPGESALGRALRTGNLRYEVVGVVSDGVYVSASEEPQAYSYEAFSQAYQASMALHVRSEGPAGPVAAAVRDAVRALDPGVALGEWRTMEDVVSFNRFGQRFVAGLSTLFAAIGLFLGALGVYGALAVQVAQRGREFGVRMALGAKAQDVLLLVLGRGARVGLVGCAVGLALSVIAARWLASLLYYAVSPYDPATLVLVPLVLVGAVLLASAVPARRATRASPVATLRQE